MKAQHLTRIGAPALLLGLVAVGCTPGSRPAALSSVPAKPERQAARRADAAMAAIKARDAAGAVIAAEEAAALAPRNAGYRAALGQAYLIAGRFTSAEASFADAVALDPAPGGPRFNLALSQIALGKDDAARLSLAGLSGAVPDADIGLALALAGDRDGAILILERAARAADAGPKARQNLALTYALAGRWAEAQAVAAQDLAGAEILVRIGEWARFARPQASWDQVASLLGVVPVADPGRPVALALRDDAVEALAAASPPPLVPAGPSISIARGDDIAPSRSPVLPAAIEPAATAFAATAPLRAKAEKPLLRLTSMSAPTPPAMLRSGGQWVIQLGAFTKPGAMQGEWSRLSSRVAALRGYAPAGSTFTASGAGTLHRLAMSGFITRNDAQRICTQIKTRGGTCFVRAAAGEQPLQWASRTNDLLAMR